MKEPCFESGMPGLEVLPSPLSVSSQKEKLIGFDKYGKVLTIVYFSPRFPSGI